MRKLTTVTDKDTAQNLPFPIANHSNPQVFISCLAAYNDGKIHGAWVEAVNEVELNINARFILFTSPVPGAEEWVISDTMNFGGIRFGEYTPTEEIVAIAQALAEHGKPFAAYRNYYGGYDVTPEFIQHFKEDYKGTFSEREDFVYEELKRKGVIRKAERIGLNEGYIDYEAVGNDWFCNDYLDLSSGECGQIYVYKRR